MVTIINTIFSTRVLAGSVVLMGVFLFTYLLVKGINRDFAKNRRVYDDDELDGDF